MSRGYFQKLQPCTNCIETRSFSTAIAISPLQFQHSAFVAHAWRIILFHVTERRLKKLLTFNFTSRFSVSIRSTIKSVTRLFDICTVSFLPLRSLILRRAFRKKVHRNLIMKKKEEQREDQSRNRENPYVNRRKRRNVAERRERRKKRRTNE